MYLEFSQYGGDVCFISQVSQNLQLKDLNKSENSREYKTSAADMTQFQGYCKLTQHFNTNSE